MSSLPVEATQPAISVVVPSYNRAPMLRRLLRALAECEAPPGGFEVIVVDDGSTDDTEAAVRGALLPVRYVAQDNAGPAAARNRGWRDARGALVAFTDDDCVPSRGWLTDAVRALNECGAAAAGGQIVPLAPGFLAEFVQAERLVGHGGDPEAVKYLVTANAVFRRDALEAVGGFDERFPGAAGEDTDLTMRLRECGLPLTLLDDAVVAHDHRTTLRSLLRTYRRHGEARQILRRLHPNAGLGAAAASMTTPGYWRTRFAYYRAEGASPLGAAIYCGLRILGLAAYASGLARATVRARWC